MNDATKKRLIQIREKLSLIGSRESSFVSVEILFYEAITLSRAQANGQQLLSSLKQLEAQEYQATKMHFRKSSQREKTIQKFISRLRKILAPQPA